MGAIPTAAAGRLSTRSAGKARLRQRVGSRQAASAAARRQRGRGQSVASVGQTDTGAASGSRGGGLGVDAIWVGDRATGLPRDRCRALPAGLCGGGGTLSKTDSTHFGGARRARNLAEFPACLLASGHPSRDRQRTDHGALHGGLSQGAAATPAVRSHRALLRPESALCRAFPCPPGSAGQRGGHRQYEVRQPSAWRGRGGAALGRVACGSAQLGAGIHARSGGTHDPASCCAGGASESDPDLGRAATSKARGCAYGRHEQGRVGGTGAAAQCMEAFRWPARSLRAAGRHVWRVGVDLRFGRCRLFGWLPDRAWRAERAGSGRLRQAGSDRPSRRQLHRGSGLARRCARPATCRGCAGFARIRPGVAPKSQFCTSSRDCGALCPRRATRCNRHDLRRSRAGLF